MQTKVTKTRNGWEVLVRDNDQCNWRSVAGFTNRTEAYAYAYQVEHNL